MKQQKLIGLDPGIRKNTGFSLYDPKSKQYEIIKSMDIIDAYAEIIRLNEIYDIVVVIENPNMDSNVYGADTNLVNYILSWSKQKAKNLKQLTSQVRKSLAWASNVGKNKGLAITIVEKLLEQQILVVQIKPSQRRRADEKVEIGGKLYPVNIKQIPLATKSTQAQFRELTGCRLKTNEHGRDSATPLWNKTFFYYANFAKTQLKVIQDKKNKKNKKNGNRHL